MSTQNHHVPNKRGVLIEIYERPLAFALTFLVFFFLMATFLAFVGATPDPVVDNTVETSGNVEANNTTVEIPATPETAVRVVAKNINLDVAVVNPTSANIEVLDEALKEGSVHYPDSAPLGVNGTVLLFGHSSYLPVVYHQYYKTFDGIQNLKPGQTVSVYSDTTEYRYSVMGVRVADSADSSDNQIPLLNDKKYLTLVTCDSFAAKSNRFVVTAEFAGAYPLH